MTTKTQLSDLLALPRVHVEEDAGIVEYDGDAGCIWQDIPLIMLEIAEYRYEFPAFDGTPENQPISYGQLRQLGLTALLDDPEMDVDDDYLVQTDDLNRVLADHLRTEAIKLEETAHWDEANTYASGVLAEYPDAQKFVRYSARGFSNEFDLHIPLGITEEDAAPRLDPCNSNEWYDILSRDEVHKMIESSHFHSILAQTDSAYSECVIANGIDGWAGEEVSNA